MFYMNLESILILPSKDKVMMVCLNKMNTFLYHCTACTWMCSN